MSCCGGNCGCGSSCKCGSGCSGCGMYPDLGITERNTSTVSVVIAGVAPVKMSYEGSEMSYGAENDGCDCGANCSCGSDCKCGK